MTRGKQQYKTFADRLIVEGVHLPADTVIFEATEVLAWVENELQRTGVNTVTDLFDQKRTMPVYPHCFIEASVQGVSAGMFVCEFPIETIKNRHGNARFVGLDFDEMKFDEVKKVIPREPTVQEEKRMTDLLESAFKFFLIIPITDYGYGTEIVNAAMGGVFDGYGMLSALVMDSSMGGLTDDIYETIGLHINRHDAVLPRSALYMALVSMSHVHHRGEVELVTHPRHVVRQHQRENGKAPSPFFRLIRPNQVRKTYESDGSKTNRVLDRHWVSGHFRTVIDHPIEWFNGTRFIKTHERGGKGKSQGEHTPRYQIRLD